MTAHVDTFARDHLPPPDQWPELVFDLPELQFPAELNCAHELLDRWVEEGHGDRLCVQGQGVRWTYADLQAQANRIARVLVDDLGLVPGNRVLLRGPNSPMLAACWFGVVKAGGIAVGSMPLLRAKELVQIVHKAEISHALCDVRLADELALAGPQCPTLVHVLHFMTGRDGGLEARAAGKPAQFDTVRTAADDTCLMAFTSGTTGAPKATLHFHRDVMAACACWPRHVLRPTADDVFIGSPPLAFTFGLGGLLLFPLSVGASTVLVERPGPDALPAAIAQYRATTLVTSPTAYRAMAGQLAAHDLSSLRQCVSAGEALPAATRQLWKDASGIEIIDGIGSTELLHIFISHDESHARPGATGTVVPGYRACVLDDDGRPLPPGQVGRLAIKGPTGCRYLADDRQRQYVSGGWNLTGDAYLQTEDGYFVYQARTDDMIISGGYNIAGPEVEAALLLHPAVAECGVVGVPDEERGQVVKAFVVLRAGHAGDAAMAKALQDFTKQAIAPYKYPRAVEFRDALPRTETGKLQRFRLRSRG
ncbi:MULTISPECIES: AMP-binding protein [unclassified Rhizobacter]|uniref:AMP-binding protein n=1 Tax=unclassified Rhizobacter TaxID=2640088 RepID=UPI0006FFDAD7|nr:MULTISPECIES: AMP-binding protein [unclassified Rhizobacter]KQU71259.1 2-aminobenzoate-CoA ligase [Rhizobacter sp. Root29]KQV97056.1 2-aminobenzoate-CoA ligase [Rhizobacter sp. Root1238]KRB24128.1 2-aminobenzoate-CoA ligase [Rhizobacter sp. Root16D2]